MASFALDTTTTAGSAQIQTKTGVTYDHEVKSSYTVVVKADDGGGGTPASVTVTIDDHGRERETGAAGGADGDRDRGIDHQPGRELD